MEEALEQHTSPDTARVDLLNALALENQFVSLVDALSYGRQALEESVKLGYVRGEGYAYRNLGSSYAIRRDFVTALQFLDRARRLFESVGLQRGIADCYISMGHIYRWQLDYREAVNYQWKAAHIYHSMEIPERYAICLHNLGEDYMQLNELSRADSLTRVAMGMLQEHNNLQVLTTCYKVLGQIELKRNNPEQAQQHFESAIKISGKLGYDAQKEATFESYLMLADIFRIRGDVPSEEGMLKAAQTLAADASMLIQQREAFRKLINFYFFYKQHGRANQAFEEFNELNEQLLTQQRKEMGNMMEQVLQTIAVANENEALKREGALQENRIRIQNYQIYIYLSTLVACGVIVAMMVRSNKQRNRYSLELSLRNQMIEEKSRHLQQVVEVKDKFFSIISHDLRAPIGTLSQFVGLLKANHSRLKPSEMEELLSKFDIQLNSTLALTDDIILWAKSEIDKAPEMELTKAADLVEGVLPVLSEQLRLKGLKLEKSVDQELMVVVNKAQMEFCIRNVLSNAAKFTKDGGLISVKVFRSNGRAAIEVRDTGVGMTPEKVAGLFASPLRQSQSQPGTAGESGKGLGLYLAGDFVKKNNGQIGVESTPGEGTILSILLPLADTSDWRPEA